MLEELFFWLGPAQIMSVFVPVVKYPTKAIITKPLCKAVILNG